MGDSNGKPKNPWIAARLWVDNLGTSVKSIEKYIQSSISSRFHLNHDNPIEILKRLQREAFSDTMKLRDRVDKLERIISVYKSNKGNPFQEPNTHLRGEISASGALLLSNGDLKEAFSLLDASGVEPGVDAKFVFDTTINKNDTLQTEFLAYGANWYSQDDTFKSSLTLKKVMYVANITDWFSFIAIPIGAKCNDLTTDLQTTRGLTHASTSWPSVLGTSHKCAAGVVLRRWNLALALGELLSQSRPELDGTEHLRTTFGQLLCHVTDGTRVALSCLSTRPTFFTQRFFVGSQPLKEHVSSATSTRNSDLYDGSNQSISLAVESHLDETMKITGWIELQKLRANSLQWAINLSDSLDDDLHWSFSVGQGAISSHPGFGLSDSQNSPSKAVQVEGNLNINIGKRISLQPGVLFVSDGKRSMPALLFRARWSI